MTDQEPRPQEHRLSFVRMKATTGAAVLHAPQMLMDIFKWPQLLSVLFSFHGRAWLVTSPFLLFCLLTGIAVWILLSVLQAV